MADKRKRYKTDLSNGEWERVRPFVEKEQTNGRPRTTDLREVLNALFYMEHTGCQWDMLPHDLPPGGTVRYWYDKWKVDDTLKLVLEHTNRQVRQAHGREESPSLLIVDSQSVKTAHGGEEVGFDGNKKVKGRKRHLFVDVLGLVFAAIITAANVSDGSQLIPLTEQVEADLPRLQTVLGDGAYGIARYPQKFTARFSDRSQPIKLEISKRPIGVKGFQVIPKRWIVERTNGWNNNSRRLSKDYERTIESSLAFVQIAAIRRNLRKLSSPSNTG
ncbi:MAG: hypothetical protein CMH57_08940 [Myxococcales bacterium]|nr:hypothetical protein [Myxococcales bacterium]